MTQVHSAGAARPSPAFHARPRLLSVSLAVAGASLAAAALMPERYGTAVLLSLSYDRTAEHLSTLVALLRVGILGAGLVTTLLALPTVRRYAGEHLFPLPADGADTRYWPGSLDGARWIWSSITFCGLGLPIFAALIVNPAWLPWMLAEDLGYESATALFYFAAAGLLAVSSLRAFRDERPLGLVHLAWTLLTIMLVWVAFEEVSYFQRIVRFDTPREWNLVNNQGEFNLHNVATGLINRVMTLGIVVGGLFLPMAAWTSRRLDHLVKRLRLQLPSGPAVLAFAYAPLFTTPARFKTSLVDEQQLLGMLVIGAFLAWVVVSALTPRRRASVGPLAVALLLLVLTKVALTALENGFPLPNYPEEYKEWLFSLGFLCYSFRIRAQSKASRPAGTR